MTFEEAAKIVGQSPEVRTLERNVTDAAHEHFRECRDEYEGSGGHIGAELIGRDSDTLIEIAGMVVDFCRAIEAKHRAMNFTGQIDHATLRDDVMDALFGEFSDAQWHLIEAQVALLEGTRW